MSSTARLHREVLVIAKNFCDDVQLETDHKRAQLVLVGPLGSRKVALPRSNSDPRVMRNMAMYIQRAAREVGAYR